jgi:RepB DNA-primase from phage plasmid
VSQSDAVRLWQHLHGKRPDLIEVFTAFRSDKGRLEMPKVEHFRPDRLEAAAEFARFHDQERNRETYFCAHQLLAPQRVKDNAAPVVCLWADVDDADLADSPIKPTAVVASSPGRTQAYARLSRPIAPLKAEALNKRWALAFGADRSGFDLTQLLRVPGTRNHKYLGSPTVKLLYIDDELTYDPADLDRILPKVAEPQNAVAYRSDAPTALSDDDQALLEEMLVEEPRAAAVWADEDSEETDQSKRDWPLLRAMVKATGLDIERAWALLWKSQRAKSRAERWAAPRNGYHDFLHYELDRAAAQPFEAWTPPPRQNDTPHRSEDPRTWPELVADIPDGPSNGKCSEHCQLRHHPAEAALRRQVELVNALIQCDVSPVFKVTLLRLVAIVGFYQSRGTTRFQTSAKKIGESIGLSAQTVRTVLHALARNDRDELSNEHGLFDLDSTRVPEAGPFCSVFEITPLTQGGYTGFLEAVVNIADELPKPAKRPPREKQEEIRPPPEVVEIPDCPAHTMHSDVVVCASCGDEYVREVRYSKYVTPEQHDHIPSPAWDHIGDTPQRFEPASKDLERLLAIYERGRA